MLVTFLRLLFIGCALVFIFMLVHAWWHKRRRGELESTPFWPVAAIGFVANFLDRCTCHSIGNHQVGVEWKMRTMLFNGTKRLHDYCRIVKSMCDLWSTQITQKSRGRNVCRSHAPKVHDKD